MPLTDRDLALAVVSVLALLVMVAAAVNGLAPRRRPRLRTSLLLFFCYTLLALLLSLARTLGAPGLAAWFDTSAQLFGVFTVVSVASVLVSEILLPRSRVPVPAIVVDLVTFAAYAMAAAGVATKAGVDAGSAIAGGTVIAAVLSISLQSTLGNVIGGVAIQMDGSLQVGDWVQLENGRQGRVAAIRWRHTLLETRDGDTIVMPNNVLLTTAYTVLGRRDGRPFPHRQVVRFRVDRRFPPAMVCEVVEEALAAGPLPNVAGTPAPDCVCLDLGRDAQDSASLYAVRYFILDLWSDDRTDSMVRGRVQASLRREGIPLALPTRTNFNAAYEQVDEDSRHVARRQRAAEAVAGVDLFRTLTPEERAELAASVRYAPFTAGEVIVRQGSVAHHLYLLADGQVEVRVRFRQQEESVSTIEAPGFFGEMGLLTGTSRLASVVAITPVECFRLDRAAFQAVIRRRPEVAAELGRVLAQRTLALDAVRMGLDGTVNPDRQEREGERLASRIREFFGLSG
jgi:small-conductance mechanosensitive channel/CRP-like cAMP-binding protein